MTVLDALATRPRQLLGIDDLTAFDFEALLDMAAVMKRHPLAWRSALEGRAVACLFEQPSTRSRVSLEVAIHRLGALPVMLSPAELRLDHGDTVADTARVLSSYCDAIAVRTTHHRDLLELVEHASVPVINVLTDREYPCRALADCLTLRDRFGDLRGLPLAYIGDCEAVAHSLIEAAMLTGLEVRIAAPPTLLPDPALLTRAGEHVRVCESPREAVRDALAVYGAAWRTELPDAYRVTPELLAGASPRAVFLHAIPTGRGREVHRAVLDGPHALTSEQAANLLPIEQAVLRALVTGDLEV
jgi:ornithine carbamoyltransferase